MSSMNLGVADNQTPGVLPVKSGLVSLDHAVATTNGKSTQERALRDVISKRLSQQDPSGSTVKLIGLNITSIPEADVELLRKVERLSLRKNLLLHLPSNFCSLKNLRYLDLDNNILREIPPVLMQCPKLEILDLSYNNIEYLPQDISTLWSQQLKVLSLKNNNVNSIWGLKSIVKLENLRVLEILGNPINQEELEAVRSYTPMTSSMVKEEYWVIALRRYLEDHSLPASESQHDSKMSKAAKRMGYVNTPSPGSGDSGRSATSSPAPIQMCYSEADSSYSTAETTNNELYNHSKFNDYFKRLSILPEEASNNEQHKVSHDELVVACRKLLFSFTECQQNVRKIASFCKEKAVAVNVVSLLYSVRSHIDNLVGVLEQAENEKNSHDGALIKLCMTIIAIFKLIIGQLRKNFKAFFGADDLCFIRMFYMTLVCSYTEIYNAWCFIDAGEARKVRSRHLARAHSAINLPSSNTSAGTSALYLPRTRSNTIQSRAPPVALGLTAVQPPMENSLHNAAGHSGNTMLSPPTKVHSPTQAKATQSAAVITPPSNSTHMHNMSYHSNESKPSDSSPRQHHTNSPRSRKVTESQVPNVRDGIDVDTGSLSTSSGGSSVDTQLYQTLNTVIGMVNVVYERLTSEISKAAMASTTGQQELTDVLLSKIRDLTDTCCQAMELSKILNERLQLLTSEADISEKLLTTNEKVITWENINAFLKSIISILANTKVVMTDMPGLNEIRPNLAALAKITKDVTVILELSSYKGVSVINQTQNSSQNQSHGYSHTVSNQQTSITGEDGDEKFYTSITTPQITPAHSQIANPFDNFAG
ncbi:hypothetical protein HG537_0F04770 [Torulaspora globosa]|uniref:L domain-like protein n=1 Tax=Torulaspora globosa TaxID=48254 RepID=A0A7H9HYR1_9SACH|nr:hypothetical protein HG537_0F04770 [Torulaspora sp. CBS 2947]